MDPEKYLRWLLETTPIAIRSWIREQDLVTSIEQELLQTIQSRSSLEHGQEFMQHCIVPGASPADYCLREIALFPQASVLAGIHFYGGDVTRPFVGVYAQSRSFSRREMLEASARLCNAFSLFKPTWTWWWLADEDGSKGHGAIQDQRLLVGDLGDIRRRPVPHAPLGTTLRADSDGSSYAEYLGIYERFIERNPSWKGRLERTEHDDYVQCARADALRIVEMEGRCAGVIAARPGRVRGIPGWEIVDEILDEEYRGRGFAACMQQLFLDQLDSNIHSLVIGTIDWANEPSRRTALRAGRQDTGGWLFMPARATDSSVAPASPA